MLKDERKDEKKRHTYDTLNVDAIRQLRTDQGAHEWEQEVIEKLKLLSLSWRQSQVFLQIVVKACSGKKDSAFSQFPTSFLSKAQADRISRAITTVGSGMNNQIDMNVPMGSHIHQLLKLAVSFSCAFLQK